MDNLESVRKALIDLGLKQGFDLSDPEISEGLNCEKTGLEWFCGYIDPVNWDIQLQDELEQFFNHMTTYEAAIKNQDIKSACRAFFTAMIYAGNISSFFDSLSLDMRKLWLGKSKTNGFPWPQFDDE